jgi:Ni/Co efflux regulator RcnB
MKKFLTTAAAVLMLAAPMSEAFAQGWNNNNRYERQDTRQNDRRDDRRGPSFTNRGHDNYGHRNWRKGGRIERHDWNRGRRISDYRRYHLQRPPRGYEWRQVDNSYVLAAAATGLIAALIMANGR